MREREKPRPFSARFSAQFVESTVAQYPYVHVACIQSITIGSEFLR